jgi:acyl-CoA synthetase (AMP-forming)/AMP-acid ligase II
MPQLASMLSASVLSGSEREALAHGANTLTYRQLDHAAARLASALELDPGDPVALVAPNVPALVVGLFAIWRSGAVAVPLSARLGRFELERAFADAQPVAAVFIDSDRTSGLAGGVAELVAQTPSLRARFVLDALGEVVSHARASASPPAQPLPHELAAILYTSGSTGEPKGGLLPHALADLAARNLADLLGSHADAPYGLVIPASHAFGLACLLCGIAGGAKAVMVDASASIEPLVRALRAHDALVLHGSPALFSRVLRSGAELPVRAGFTAGSPCPPHVLQALDQRGASLLNVYGMTEIGAASSCRVDDPPSTRYHTVGRALPGYELRVAPAEEHSAVSVVKGGEPGEIQVRSSYLPAGYHRRAWGETELAEGGWFRTGDLGALDDAGNLTISGRAKELVYVGGFNVFPAEVESFLLTHPAIAQAAVIGVPHPVLGEAVQAFVVAAAGTALEPRDVIRFARSGIAGYKVPYEVQVLRELPLLPSGKPDRRALVHRTPRASAPEPGPAEAPR